MHDDDAREELQAHLDMQVEQLEAMGRSHEDAVREARLRFGNVRSTLEAIDSRQSRVQVALEEMRSSLRSLLRQPGFLAATVLPLALAMTLTVVTFGVVDAVLVRPLPYVDADRIVRVGERRLDSNPAHWASRTTSAGTIEAWEQETQTIARFAFYLQPFRTLSLQDERVRIPSAAVSVGFFDVLNLPPFAGRYFQPDDVASADDRPVAVLSHAFWQRTLHGDAAAVGRTIVLDDIPTLVVGVAPPELRFPARTTPLWTLRRNNDPAFGGGTNAIAVLRPGATVDAAAAEGTVIAQRRRAESHSGGDEGSPMVMDVTTLADDYAAPVRRGLLLFAAAALTVLAAATLHVGHLFVVYAQRRRREFAVRAALGAAPWRLVAMAVTTVAGVSIAAGAFALLLATATHAALPTFLPSDFPRLDDIAFSLRSLLVVAGTIVLTTAIGGAIVTRHLARRSVVDPAGALGSGGVRATVPVRARSTLALLVGEVAFSAALLIVAGLLARSFIELATTDSGYAPESALSAQVSFPPATAQFERRQIVERLLTSLSALPGVVAAGTSNALPLEEVKLAFRFDGEDAGPESVSSDFDVVSPGYLEALGARVVEGRGFAWEDAGSSPPVALVNRAFMRRYFPDRDAIGFRIPGAGPDNPLSVIGVVDDVRLEGPAHEAQPAVYFSILQRDQATFFNRVNLVVRATGDPLGLTGTVRDLVRSTDDRLALADVTTLDRQLSAAVARPRLYATMLVTCAALALVIVVIGLFASLAYAAARRRREVAIRMAIGAQRTSVAALLARDSVVVMVIGLLIGTAAGLAAGRVLAGLLHGVDPADPVVIAMTMVAMTIATAAAAAVPIAGALKTDLARELRSE